MTQVAGVARVVGRARGCRRYSRLVADRSAIEWTEATWNPTRGCTKVSEGCEHCYAESFAERWRGLPGHPYEQGFDPRVAPAMLLMPLRWRRPRLVFVNSMSDLFHDAINDDYIAQVFAVMGAAPQHTFQVLTKRHARMRSLVNQQRFRKLVMSHLHDPRLGAVSPRASQWPFPNVWLGVSVENQHWADIRVPALIATPAAVRFLSCEPLLGPVHVESYLANLHWVIAGGESGPGARPMHPDWARSLRDQCAAANVAYFFKQWGAWVPSHEDAPHAAAKELDGGVRVVRLSKHRAGRQLDGRTWDLMPTGVGA